MINSHVSEVLPEQPPFQVLVRGVCLSVACDPAADREVVVPNQSFLVQNDASTVIVGVHLTGELELLKVVLARGALGLLLRAGERRQKQAGKHADDGNDDQQLDQREAAAL